MLSERGRRLNCICSIYDFRDSSGSLATLAAIRRASSRVSNLAAKRYRRVTSQ